MGAAKQSELLAKVTFGIRGTAMPTWGEFLPVDQRWDVIRFIVESFGVGKAATAGATPPGQVAANMITLSTKDWLKEGNTISAPRGDTLYATYCTTCHGDRGQGNGPGMRGSASQAPRPFSSAMSHPYIFWRVRDGVSGGIMPAFQWKLKESDIWDITAYVQTLTARNSGGSP